MVTLRGGTSLSSNWLKLAGLIALALPLPAMAQTAAPPPATAPPHAVDEINIVGRRAAADAQQRQPDSVTVISRQELVNENVRSVPDLIKVAPNLIIQPSFVGAGLNFALRGVGFYDYTQVNTPSVLPYLDGIAYPISIMTTGILFDMDNVSVVQGPSGFTHGQATTGGEIDFQTAGPTSQFHAGLTEDYASYNRSRTDAYVSGPLTDSISGRIAGEYSTGGGFQHDAQGDHYGDADTGALRAKLKWDIDDTSSLQFGGHWTKDNSQPPAIHDEYETYSVPLSNDFYNTEWGLDPQFAKVLGIDPSDTKPREDNQFWGINAGYLKNFSDFRLSVLNDLEGVDEHELTDQSGTVAPYGEQFRINESNLYSLEIKLESIDPSARFQWQTGLYYQLEHQQENYFWDETARGASFPYIIGTYYTLHHQAISEYVHLSYDLLPKLRLIGAINHEADERQLLNSTSKNISLTNGSVVSDIDYGDSGALTNQYGGSIGLQYQFTPDVMGYGTISRGFKPGGFNANTLTTSLELQAFKPESLISYEAGIKTDLLDNRLRFNAAAFYYDYHNKQEFSTQFVGGILGVLGGYVNAPRSYIYGAEFDVEATPIHGLTLAENFGYENGVYQDFTAANRTAITNLYAITGVYSPIFTNYSGDEIGLPAFSLSGSAAYKFPIADEYNISFDIDYSYRSDQVQAQYIDQTGIYRAPAYALFNSYVMLAPANERWSATIYVQNVADRKYWLSYGTQANFYGVEPGAPRFIGGRVSWKY